MYYGIKKFWKRLRRPPLKGKKRVRIDYVESDWRYYKTSNPFLMEDLVRAPGAYRCQIIQICHTVTQMKVAEAFYQLNAYMDGDWDNLYNEVIHLRLRIPKSK